MFAARRVLGRAHVHDGRIVLQGDEGVAEPLGEVDGPPVDVVQENRIPLAEGRRADPDVDGEVEDGAAQAGHVFGLRRRDVGEVDAAHGSRLRHGGVRLAQVEPVAHGLLEGARLVGFQEHPAVVGELPGCDLPGAGNRQLADLHVGPFVSFVLGIREPSAGRLCPGRSARGREPF